MAQNARQHTIPAGSETSVNRATFFETFGNSIHDVVPVANATARAALVGDLDAAGQDVTSSNPLVVLRGDAPGGHRVEYSYDGSVWLPASGVHHFSSKAAADSFGTANGSLLSVGDRAYAAGVELTWTGTQWVGDWRSASVSGSGFEVFGNGVRFRRIGSVVYFDVYATKATPWTANWSVAPIPSEHRPSANVSQVSIFGDVPREVQFTPAGSVVIVRAGDTGIALSGSYSVG